MQKGLISTNMKIFMLLLFLLSITFYASGCIVLVKSGYKLSDYANELNINPDAFKFNLNVNGLNFDFNNSSISKDYTLNDNITEIDINLNSQDIKVVNYDGQDLKVQIKSHSNVSNELPMTENGNKLIFNTQYDTPSNATISVSVPNKFTDKGTFKVVTSSGHIDVSNLNVNTLSLSSASGDINASDLNLNYLVLNSSSGEIKFDTIKTSTETKFTSASGDIIGSGTLGTVTGNTSSGDINLKFKDSLSNTALSTASGSVSLSFPKNLGYKVNYETVSGDLNSPSNELSFGDGSSLINVNTTSGDLNVK
jgi:lia operon protein LiaG